MSLSANCYKTLSEFVIHLRKYPYFMSVSIRLAGAVHVGTTARFIQKNNNSGHTYIF